MCVATQGETDGSVPVLAAAPLEKHAGELHGEGRLLPCPHDGLDDLVGGLVFLVGAIFVLLVFNLAFKTYDLIYSIP